MTALSLLAAPPASANTYSYTQSAIGPGGVYSGAAWLSGGAQACQTTSAALPFFCGANGFGGALFDVSSLDASAQFVVGTCTVRTSSPQLLGGGYTFVCSTDRDDDGRYSNVDGVSSSTDRFDDDFIVGDETQTSVDFCFRRDGTSAGADWDFFSVFLEGRDGFSFTSNAIGGFSITITASTATSCGGGNVSAHSTGLFEDTDGPSAPTNPPNSSGWACTDV